MKKSFFEKQCELTLDDREREWLYNRLCEAIVALEHKLETNYRLLKKVEPKTEKALQIEVMMEKKVKTYYPLFSHGDEIYYGVKDSVITEKTFIDANDERVSQ